MATTAGNGAETTLPIQHRPHLVVVDGRPVRVSLRTAIMVEQLIKRGAKLDAIPKGDIEIRFAPNDTVTCSDPRAYGTAVSALDNGA